MEHNVCGMGLCQKCGTVTLVFGVLFLVAGFGLWANAPTWWNGWTLVGIFLFVWGLSALFMKQH